MKTLRLLAGIAAVCAALPPARADVVPPPRGVIEGRFTRDAVPWARPGRNFAVMVDTLGIALSLPASYSIQSLEETWWTRTAIQPWEDVDVVVYFTTVENPSYGAFYSPLANDIAGLGYGEWLSARMGTTFPDLFDVSPDTLSGIVVANDFHSYLSQPWLLPVVIEQELGHKWCCFVRESVGQVSPTELLGRDQSHWSYFVDTGSSPLEGNSWAWDGATTFTTYTADVYQAGDGMTPFSQLDLYLMGLLPPADVDPWFLIQNPDTMGQLDLYGYPITASSMPQMIGEVSVDGSRFGFTVDDIVDRNGPRVPAEWDGALKVAMVLLVQPEEADDKAVRNQFAYVIDRAESLWIDATGGRSHLVNVTRPVFGAAGDQCDGAMAACGDGLDCVAFDGRRVCAAPCDGYCGEGNCCVESDDDGRRCVTPEVVECVPLTAPEGECDGGPCEEGGSASPVVVGGCSAVGGGCSAVGGGGGGAFALALAATILASRRRRR